VLQLCLSESESDDSDLSHAAECTRRLSCATLIGNHGTKRHAQDWKCCSAVTGPLLLLCAQVLKSLLSCHRPCSFTIVRLELLFVGLSIYFNRRQFHIITD
jgi:hypothetical protein